MISLECSYIISWDPCHQEGTHFYVKYYEPGDVFRVVRCESHKFGSSWDSIEVTRDEFIVSDVMGT